MGLPGLPSHIHPIEATADPYMVQGVRQRPAERAGHGFLEQDRPVTGRPQLLEVILDEGPDEADEVFLDQGPEQGIADRLLGFKFREGGSRDLGKPALHISGRYMRRLYVALVEPFVEGAEDVVAQ